MPARNMKPLPRPRYETIDRLPWYATYLAAFGDMKPPSNAPRYETPSRYAAVWKSLPPGIRVIKCPDFVEQRENLN